MLFNYISILLGIIKLGLFKIVYRGRISIGGLPKINCDFHLELRAGTHLSIGKNFRGRHNITVRNDMGGQIRLGDNVFLNDNVSLNCQRSIVIGDNVSVGHNVVIIDHDHDYRSDMRSFVSEEVKIGNNAWIGANVTILKGATIGENAVIGANTLIKEDVAAYSRVVEKREYRRGTIIKGEQV